MKNFLIFRMELSPDFFRKSLKVLERENDVWKIFGQGEGSGSSDT